MLNFCALLSLHQLPTNLLQDGLVETLTVEPEHLKIFTQLCQQHIGGPAGQTRDWNRGAELVFTWRKSGVLEIRAHGELVCGCVQCLRRVLFASRCATNPSRVGLRSWTAFRTRDWHRRCSGNS